VAVSRASVDRAFSPPGESRIRSRPPRPCMFAVDYIRPPAVDWTIFFGVGQVALRDVVKTPERPVVWRTKFAHDDVLPDKVNEC